MLLNQSSATVCHHCSASPRWLLHSVHHQGSLLRLCTICVLRLHPHSFCPSCFTVYLQGTPSDGLQCSNCGSVSHASCAGINPKSPFVCPMCQCPSGNTFGFKNGGDFDRNIVGGSGEKGLFIDGNGVRNLKKGGNFDGIGGNGEKGMFIDGNGVRNLKKGGSFDGIGGGGGNGGKGMFSIDGGDVRVLEAGFAISCYTMSEAALDKRCEAERRAWEAVHTRKRAKQALEHMAGVVAKEKMRRKDGGGAEADVPRFWGNVGGVMERRDIVGNGVGVGTSAGAGSLEKNQVVGNLERLEMSSNGVLAREVNAVECREKEGSGGIRPESNGATMDVDELRDMSLGSSLDVGDASGENHGGGIVCEISINPDQLNQSAERISVSNNIVVLSPPKEDQSQVVEIFHPEQNNSCLKH